MGTGREQGFSVWRAQSLTFKPCHPTDYLTQSSCHNWYIQPSENCTTVLLVFFPTFSLCSWVQLEVADVNLGADVTLVFCCLQRNTSGKGHWAKETQHIQEQWLEPLCDLLSPAFPPKGEWHSSLGPAAHTTSFGYSCSDSRAWPAC